MTVETADYAGPPGGTCNLTCVANADAYATGYADGYQKSEQELRPALGVARAAARAEGHAQGFTDAAKSIRLIVREELERLTACGLLTEPNGMINQGDQSSVR